jgi:type IV pilus assembly protein PilF
MKPLILLLAALSLAGCVTVGPDGQRQHEPNMTEAARANAQLAMQYIRNGNFDLAQEKALRAISQDNSVALGHAALAFVYAHKNEDADAVKEYRRAVDLDPKDLAIRNNFAVFECDHGNADDAMEIFSGLARDKNYSEPAAALQNAGVCARRAGKLDKAEGFFRDALSVQPDDPESLLQMAALNAQKQDWLKVRAFIQRRDRVANPIVESLKLGIQAERALGDYDAAGRYERRLQKDFPKVPASSG